MVQQQALTRPAPQAPFLADFQPLRALWEVNPPIYPSEQAARWGLRILRKELAAAEAVAMHGRNLLVHPERVARVIERAALDRFKRSAGVPS